MTTRSLPDMTGRGLAAGRPKPAGKTSAARPREGNDRGEILHFLRALLLLVLATAAFGWLMS